MTRRRSIAWVVSVGSAVAVVCTWGVVGAREAQSAQAALAEPFKGVTTNGTVNAGLFPVKRAACRHGRSACGRHVHRLAHRGAARLDAFPVDDEEWRKWNNVHRYARQGMSFNEMSAAQKDAAFAFMRASLSAKGFEQTQNTMRLNGYLAELVKNAEEYGRISTT